MTLIYPEQLEIELQKEIKPFYILYGEDYYSLESSYYSIIKKIKSKYVCKNIKIELNVNYDWENILYVSKNLNLFEKKKYYH